MEFGVAAFSTVVSVALSKLCSVRGKKVQTDATLISDKLRLIRATMEDHAPRCGHLSWVQTEWIAQVRRLAYDIEDCIDCFDAKKMTPKEFAEQIAKLKARSEDMEKQTIALATEQSLMGPTARTAVVVTSPTERREDPLGNWNCLLYLCLFPPSHRVRTKPLMRRWLAEGLVQGKQAAVENLGFFIGDSSIIDSITIERSNNGQVKGCQPTAETFQYISQRSISENFILVCDGAVESQAGDARRLSVYPSGNPELDFPQDLSHLRTLAVFPDGKKTLHSYEAVLDFRKYGVLRVLELKECAHLREGHLRDICNQVLMKYLSINVGSIGKITRKIGNLDQLETLDLSKNETVTVFKEVLLLPKLKHLFGKFQLSIRDTPSVPILGWITSDLENYLEDKSVLETLSGFVTGRRIGFSQLMSLMWRLRKVKMWCKSNASQTNLSAISSAIAKFIHDETGQPDRSLSIDLQGCSGEFLNTIHKKGKLASLKLHGHLSKLPAFVAQLSGIKELCISSTGLSWEVILEVLTNFGILKYLKLIEDELGRIKIEPHHLKSIKWICVVCKTSLDITIEANALLHLVSLHILCQDLHVIPGTPGIEINHMAELKEIGLPSKVQDTIKSTWEDAESHHLRKPIVLLIEDP